MFYWIDSTAQLAYINPRGSLTHFGHSLFADPQWQRGMAVVEDLRELTEQPPSTCIAEWRTYVQEHRSMLPRKWALILRRPASPRLCAILTAAVAGAACCDVSMQLFTSMCDAHVWLARHDAGTPRAHGIGAA